MNYAGSMPTRMTHLPDPPHQGRLTAALQSLREEFDLPSGFPDEVHAEARTVTAPAPDRDFTDLPFVTLDPPGSRDLDQAFHLARSGSGFTVRYAIADIPGLVATDTPLDLEAKRRGQTLYLPDGIIPLHPPVLSEDRASLLPGATRTAYVWTIELDSDGVTREVHVERALIRSRAQLDYVSAQADIEEGRADGPLALLPVIGRLRIDQERARGGANLMMPDEEIIRSEKGYEITLRHPLPIEDWNAQLSLLTGMCAGNLMLDAGVGILRTMPQPSTDQLAHFRAQVTDLGVPWSQAVSYGEYLRTLDRSAPYAPAVLHAATALFRGADYTVLGDASTRTLPPEAFTQAAIAAPYAHVTAPIRRLVDRWGLIVCEALCQNRPIPERIAQTLSELPALMRASSSRAGQLGAAALDRVEAALLADRIGAEYEAIVVDAREQSARVQIADPPITATCIGSGFVAGEHVRVRVEVADIATGTIELARV